MNLQRHEEVRYRASIKHSCRILDFESKELFDESNIKNISLNGVLFYSAKDYNVGSIVFFEIKLKEEAILIESKVVRTDSSLVALTFEKMEEESYTHLKNIVMYNSEKPEKFLVQCKNRPGFK